VVLRSSGLYRNEVLPGELRAAGRGEEAATLGSGMWALRKDQQKLTPGQLGTLAQIAVVNKPLYKRGT